MFRVDFLKIEDDKFDYLNLKYATDSNILIFNNKYVAIILSIILSDIEIQKQQKGIQSSLPTNLFTRSLTFSQSIVPLDITLDETDFS